jgi:ABC-type glycerol-3-phosphate transport system substrate-binding protein
VHLFNENTSRADRFLWYLGIAVLVVALGITLIARRPAFLSAPPPERPLIFTQWWVDALAPDTLEGLIREFEALHPGIRVQLDTRPYGEIRDLLYALPGKAVPAADPAEGKKIPGPDILGLDPHWVQELAEKGVLEGLGAYPPDDVETAPGARLDTQEEAPYRNWALPLVSSMTLLYYREDLL